MLTTEAFNYCCFSKFYDKEVELANYWSPGISHVVNPGISRGGKYPQNLENEAILGNRMCLKL